MARPRIDPDLAAAVLLDAVVHGDKTAADRHGVSEKTVQRYRARTKSDEKLSEVVAEKTARTQLGWHHARANFLRAGLQKAKQLIELANQPEHLPGVIEAISAVGNLEIALATLGAGHREPSAEAAEASGGEPAEEDEDGDGEDLAGPPPPSADGMGQ
jgi:hypothetical protein